MDQSGAFDVMSHPILEQKLLHIGLCEDSVQLIMSYFRERKQYVSLNTQESEILLTGEVGTGQGSVVSGLFYSIYILDMNSQFHNKPHINNSSYNRCKKTATSTFVDDCFSVIEVKNKENLWKEIENTIQIMNTYYTNNRLKNNVKKNKNTYYFK